MVDRTIADILVTAGVPEVTANALVEMETEADNSAQATMQTLMRGLVQNIDVILNGGRAGEVGAPLATQLGRAVNVCAYGADPTGVADSTAAFNAAFIAARAAATEERTYVFVPPGEYNIAGQVIGARETSLIGGGSVFTKLFCNFGGDAFIFPERLIDNQISGLTFTHQDNADATASHTLLQLEDGSIGSQWVDLTFEAGSATLNGFICHGENPNTLVANNRGYNNDMVRCQFRSATGFAGIAPGIAFHGRGTTQTNTGYNGNYFSQTRWARDSFATHCRIDGANNLMFACTMNPTLTAGLHIQRDRTNGGDANYYFGIFDSVWNDGPKVLIVNNIDSYVNMINIANGILPEAFVRAGTFADKAQFSIFGIEDYLLGGKNNRTSLSLCPRISTTLKDGFLRFHGDDDLEGGGIVMAGPDLAAGNNAVEVGGIGINHAAGSGVAFARINGPTNLTRYAEMGEGFMRLIEQGAQPLGLDGSALGDGAWFYANAALGATLGSGEGFYAVVAGNVVPFGVERLGVTHDIPLMFESPADGDLIDIKIPSDWGRGDLTAIEHRISAGSIDITASLGNGSGQANVAGLTDVAVGTTNAMQSATPTAQQNVSLANTLRITASNGVTPGRLFLLVRLTRNQL